LLQLRGIVPDLIFDGRHPGRFGLKLLHRSFGKLRAARLRAVPMRVRHRSCAPKELCLPAVQEEAWAQFACNIIETQQTASHFQLRPSARIDPIQRDYSDRHSATLNDFKKVHRCAVLSAEIRAGQYKHLDIAAAHLRGMIDEFREKVA
jgi:hypothetical protein